MTGPNFQGTSQVAVAAGDFFYDASADRWWRYGNFGWYEVMTGPGWPPVPPPLPERWIEFHETEAYSTIAVCRTPRTPGVNVVAIVHVWTDEDGVDRASVERVGT